VKDSIKVIIKASLSKSSSSCLEAAAAAAAESKD
jgi:hypothetical protein